MMRNRFMGAVSALAVFSAALAGQASASGFTSLTLKDGVTPVDTPTPLPITCPDGTCSGGGGGSLSATASATPTPVTAGTNKPLNIGLFSNLFSTLVDSSGNVIDFSTPTPVTQSGTWTFGLNAAVTGGATPHGLQTTASTNSTNVKNTAGVLYAVTLENPVNTVIYYLRTYDSATAPTCSSSTGFVRSWAIPVPPSSGMVGGITVHLPPMGTQFNNGISYCVTGGPTSTDNTNAAAGLLINLDYK